MSREEVMELAESYGVDVDSSEPMDVSGAKTTTSVYRVNRPDLMERIFVVDTPEGREIACHPHIVGDELKAKAHASAREAAEAILDCAPFLQDSRKMLVHHILRAAPGYELKPELNRTLRRRGSQRRIRHVSNRTKYVGPPSYRDHGTRRQIMIVYRNYRNLPEDTDITLIVPDTFATLGSFEKSVGDLLRQCEKRRTRVRGAILYGFVSDEACLRLNKFEEETEVPTVVFAIEAVTALASNGYDMPFYGYDENGEPLGGVTSRHILEQIASMYVPGLDTVGDWSARQKRLGDMQTHLRNTIELVQQMLKRWQYEEWQRAIAESELHRVQRKLETIS